MRKVLSLLSEVRAESLSQAGASDERVKEARDLFTAMDNGMSGIPMTGNSFDNPESKLLETMTSADFQYAIGEFIQRRIIPSYKRKVFNFEPLVKMETVPNFMEVTRYQNRQGVDDLEYIGEKGIARAGSHADATKRQFRVVKWGKQFDFSMEAIVNDDLGYLNDQAMLMGAAARRSLEKFVSRLFTNATSIARLTGS